MAAGRVGRRYPRSRYGWWSPTAPEIVQHLAIKRRRPGDHDRAAAAVRPRGGAGRGHPLSPARLAGPSVAALRSVPPARLMEERLLIREKARARDPMGPLPRRRASCGRRRCSSERQRDHRRRMAGSASVSEHTGFEPDRRPGDAAGPRRWRYAPAVLTARRSRRCARFLYAGEGRGGWIGVQMLASDAFRVRSPDAAGAATCRCPTTALAAAEP